VTDDAASAIAALTELTAAHPFREELWALLMTALYRTGRQGDALAAYQRAREHLVDELGVEPGPRLRALEAQILEHDDGLRDGAAAAAPPARQRERPRGTVTFGYAQVADATRLWGEHRRKMALAVSRLDTVVQDVTRRHDGTVFTAAGESVCAAFHRADDAAAWATQLQVAVEQEPWPGGVDLGLQVALHTGETEEQDAGYFGPAVHTVVQMAAAAGRGQTVASGVTAALLEREDLRDLGAHRFDGIAGEHDILQLDEGDHPPLRSASRRGNLPLRLGRLIGRDDALEMVAHAMEASPVVTLVGPGGVGKTALALAGARRSEVDDARRVWLVELAEIARSGDVVQAAAETLGVTGGGGRTLTQSVVAVLRSRPTLLVLDNCEHVVEGAAALVRAIVDDAPGTRVLATSREGLGIPGERLIAVPPLEAPGPAVELFAERASAASTTFDLAAVRDDVEEICRRLDGLPLAIELAAARATSLTPGQLLARLDSRLRLLGSSRRAGSGRHRTLRATVQWSYDLLSPPQQVLFEQLGVFVGPFDLAAAEAVGGGVDQEIADTDHLLGDLVERSIVAVEAGPLGRRFRMLEALRQFALERLADREALDEMSGRHARWCAEETARIGRLLAGPGEVEGVARLAELWPNLRSAVDWACGHGDVELADALVRPIAVEVDLRRQTEIGDWAERILDLADPDDEARVVFWLLWAGHRRAQAGEHQALTALVQRHGYGDHPVVRFNAAYIAEVGEDSLAVAGPAIAWLREQGEDHAADLIEVSGLASSLMTLQRFADLAELAAGMSRLHASAGPATLCYFWLGMQGYAAQYQGQNEEAERFFTEAEAIELPAGTYRVIQTATARMAFEHGERQAAYRILRDNINGVLDSDYVDVTRMIAVEFIKMAGAVDRLADAAAVLTYVDTTGDYGRLAREHLVGDVARRVEADPALQSQPAPVLDAHEALVLMRDVLDDLVA
jgi:predicted ATPase